MNLAKIYISSGICENVLIVAGSAQIGGKYGFGADLTDPMCLHLGDGAGAAVVSKNDLKCELLSYHMETYAVTPRKTGTLNGDYGPVRPPMNRDLCFAAEMDDKYGAYLVLDDPAFDEIAGKSGFFSSVLERGAQKVGIRLDSIDHVITCHIGPFLEVWKRDLKDIGLNPGILKNSQREIGNAGCADTLIDLAVFAGRGVFHKGDTIALWSVCPGVQAAVVFLRWL